MKLAERVAIVTGGALGIGKAIATACAREGARIVLCDIAAPALAAAEAEIRALGASALSLRVDVTDGAQVAAMVETVLKTWGRVDILVNNAGGAIGPKRLAETRDDEWDAVVNLNLKGQFLCCREAAAPMRRQAWGRIINIASNAGRYRSNTGSGGLAYSAAKGGVLQLTRSVAHELGSAGITVNSIAPGSVLSERGWREFEALPVELRERVLAETREQVTRRRLNLVCLDIGEEHAGPGLDQSFRRREPETLSRSRHDGHPSGEPAAIIRTSSQENLRSPQAPRRPASPSVAQVACRAR